MIMTQECLHPSLEGTTRPCLYLHYKIRRSDQLAQGLASDLFWFWSSKLKGGPWGVVQNDDGAAAVAKDDDDDYYYYCLLHGRCSFPTLPPSSVGCIALHI